MPILFTAIEIPASLQAAICKLRPDSLGVNKSGALHITLHYIGKTNDDEVNVINKSLSKVKANAYSQKISGVDAFNRSRVPHILWAGVNKCQDLINLHHSIGKSLVETGLELEAREYIPHITIARIYKFNREFVESFLNQHQHFQADFDVTAFSLYSSERNDSGVYYKKIQSYDLTGQLC